MTATQARTWLRAAFATAAAVPAIMAWQSWQDGGAGPRDAGLLAVLAAAFLVAAWRSAFEPELWVAALLLFPAARAVAVVGHSVAGAPRSSALEVALDLVPLAVLAALLLGASRAFALGASARREGVLAPPARRLIAVTLLAALVALLIVPWYGHSFEPGAVGTFRGFAPAWLPPAHDGNQIVWDTEWLAWELAAIGGTAALGVWLLRRRGDSAPAALRARGAAGALCWLRLGLCGFGLALLATAVRGFGAERVGPAEWPLDLAAAALVLAGAWRLPREPGLWIGCLLILPGALAWPALRGVAEADGWSGAGFVGPVLVVAAVALGLWALRAAVVPLEESADPRALDRTQRRVVGGAVGMAFLATGFPPWWGLPPDFTATFAAPSPLLGFAPAWSPPPHFSNQVFVHPGVLAVEYAALAAAATAAIAMLRRRLRAREARTELP